MSCSPDAPYKSRLFNFLNRQSQQWRDRGAKATRYVQLGVVWGLQILAYPAYLLVQGSRWTGRQLQQKTRQILKQLPASPVETETEPEELTVDRPIQRILSAAEPLLLQAATVPEGTGVTTAALSQADSGEIPVKVGQKLKGIACCLETRSLVLVAENNVILDVLSPEQQEKLQQRLILELADWYYCQQQQIAATEPLRFDAPPGDDSPVLKPVQWFWGVMRWVQKSPVAIAINLFQEASLIANPSPPPPPPTLELPPGLSGYTWNLERLAQLDDRLARLEAQAESLTMSFAVGKLRLQVATLAERLQHKLHTSDDAAAANSIQALIYGAIDYFFGDRNSQIRVEGQEEGQNAIAGAVPAGGLKRLKLPNLAGLLPKSKPKTLDLPQTVEIEDPWLTWTDLYGAEKVIPEPLTKVAVSRPQLDEGLETPTLRSPLTLEKPGPLAPTPSASKPPKSSRKPPFWQKFTKPRSTPAPGALTATETTTEPSSSSPGTITPHASPKDAIDPAFDWVETEATSVGYVKHPLEQILEWLDDIMLWLENLVVAIWQWFYRRIP